MMDFLVQHSLFLGAIALILFICLEFDTKLPSKIHQLVFWLNMLIATVIFIVGAVEKDRQDKENEKLTSIVKHASLEAENANKSASASMLKSIELEKKNAEILALETARDAAQTPRELPVTQLTAMIRDLEGVPKTPIELMIPAMDDEARQFGSQIEALLHNAKIKFSASDYIGTGVKNGLTISYGKGQDCKRTAHVLAKTFASFNPALSADSEQESVSIKIGRKP